MSYNEKRIIDKMKKILPDENDKALFCTTFLGVSGAFTYFISQNFDIKELPVEIQYAIILTSANMIAMTSDNIDDDIYKKIDMRQFEKIALNEQDTETIFRKMKFIIKDISKMIEDMENVP